jgi:hypothetical protein
MRQFNEAHGGDIRNGKWKIELESPRKIAGISRGINRVAMMRRDGGVVRKIRRAKGSGLTVGIF